MTAPRPRRIALLVALVATLALLCCGGSISALLLGGFGSDDDLSLYTSGCGTGGPVDPDSKLPRLPPYGPAHMKNAAIIINVGAKLKMPPRAWVIAVATAMQESGLRNLGHLGKENDHDSLGLFQQRPETGWGTPAQVTDPTYAATKFYEKLKTIDGWETMPLTRAAQRVQISAYPDAYAKHEPVATRIVNLLADGAANAVGNSLSMVCASGADIAASGWTSPFAVKAKDEHRWSVGSGFRTAQRPDHHGVDIIAGLNTPVRSVSSGVVSRVMCDETFSGVKDCDRAGYPGKGGCGWMVEIRHAGNIMTRYCHLVKRPDLKVGQRVAAGQVIAYCGSSGNSSGPHLHFEVHRNNDTSSASAEDPVEFMAQRGAPLTGSQ
ncbi:M23 family metallopeptidase [Couchioplanes caeruleus]|uniref:Peptidase M23 n=2 Tax=Couchioplanes caeruleus TaxID=56438 RepID=A0A1K0FME6_9ACTN|nr:M23 family metallopeptidase [Couchioplanes caeruleus]OJF13896.1 peptidase M23 [Couchioplanes caeruleus subsp. caeruleus]ROP31531.1 peptidase M23-like protein [Couchioplanes caeruleus]